MKYFLSAVAIVLLVVATYGFSQRPLSSVNPCSYPDGPKPLSKSKQLHIPKPQSKAAQPKTPQPPLPKP